MINFIAEGEVIVSHTLCSAKFTGTKAICSVHGAFAGSDPEHVDEPIPVCVSPGRNETQHDIGKNKLNK